MASANIPDKVNERTLFNALISADNGIVSQTTTSSITELLMFSTALPEKIG